MPMPKKPEGLKKVSVNLTLSPAILATIADMLEPGQNRSQWINDALANYLKQQGIKVKKTVKK